MRPLIAVDICNTLADVIGTLERVLGPHPNPSRYKFPGATEEFFKQNLWIFDQAKVIPGALKGVKLLASVADIIYLTARPVESRSSTLQWLLKHGFPKALLIHTSQKRAIARQLNVKLAVDDAPHEIDALSQICPVLVHARPYNKGYTGRFEWGQENILKATLDLFL